MQAFGAGRLRNGPSTVTVAALVCDQTETGCSARQAPATFSISGRPPWQDGLTAPKPAGIIHGAASIIVRAQSTPGTAP